MTDMIEQVARAAGITPEQAIAALKAISEPTDEMVDAVKGDFSAVASKAIYTLMIDAALKGTEQ